MELRSTDQINMIPLPFYEVHTTLIQGLPVNCSDLGDVRNRIPQFRRIAFTLSIDHANLCSSTTYALIYSYVTFPNTLFATYLIAQIEVIILNVHITYYYGMEFLYCYT